MKSVLIFARMQIVRMLRDPVSLFFIVLFPLLFLFIFGNLYGNQNNNVSFNIAILNNSKSEFAKEFAQKLAQESKIFKINKDVKNLATAKDLMNKSEIDATIVMDENFGKIAGGEICAKIFANQNSQNSQNSQDENYVKNCLPSGELKVLYAENSAQAGTTIGSIMSGSLDEINSAMTNYRAPLSVKTESTKEKGMSSFDYVFAGLFAYTLMTMGIYGLANQLPSEKKKGSLKRIQATPFKKWQIVVGSSLSYLAVSIISAAIMVCVAIFAFGFQISGGILTWLSLAIFSIISVFMFCGFGMIVAGFSRNEQQSSLLSQIVAIPMMFLGGVFFPLFLMPDWIQAISKFIPMTPVGEGVRMITTEGASLLAVLPQLGIISGCAILAYFVAFKVFRWE